jgi:hypothetical protein
MKLNNWNTNVIKVRAWAEHQDPSDKLSAVNLSIMLGDSADTDDLRSTYWTAIRAIGGTMEGFPSARRGRESTLTDEQEAVLVNVEETVATAIAQIPSKYQDMLLAVIVPHGRTGGVFDDFLALIDSFRDKAHKYMNTAIKENRWDGVEVDGNGIPMITPTTTKADSEDNEEE